MFHKPKEVKSVKDFCKISVQSPLGLPLCVPGKLIGIWIPRYRNSNILKKLGLFFFDETYFSSFVTKSRRDQSNLLPTWYLIFFLPVEKIDQSTQTTMESTDDLFKKIADLPSSNV